MKLNSQNMWTAVLFLVGTALQVGGYLAAVAIPQAFTLPQYLAWLVRRLV